MITRLEWAKASPDAYAAMLGLEKALAKAGLERPLIELVYLRTSQINGCAYCVNMHANDARKAGETEQRLQALCVWQETPTSPRASAPPWPGPSNSPASVRGRCRTACSTNCASTSTTRRSPN